MVKPTIPYWFPAKASGLGWGPPVTWQGWVFFVAWLIVVLGTPAFFKDRIGQPLIFVIGMGALLFVVLYFKGEPLDRPPRTPE
jgi:hypothetical protein